MKKLFSICIALWGLTLAVSCNNDKPGGDDPSVNDGLVIEASPRYILADGVQTTNFTVKNKGVDVTSQVKIVNYVAGGSKTLASPSFKTTEATTHVFYATYAGMSSEKITVVGATALPSMPIDVMPSKYDFKKRVLIVESTGAWCQACPYAIKALHDFAARPKADDAVIVASHNGDVFENPTTIMINNTLNILGFYPTLFMEMSNDQLRFPEPDYGVDGELRVSVDKLLKAVASNGIAMSTQVVDGKICVRAEIKAAKAGPFAVGALLLEDNLFEKQVNGTPIVEEYLDYHQFVIRAGAPTEKLWESVGGVAKVAAQTKYEYYCEFDASDIKVMANSRVALFVFDVNTQSCDNVVEVKVGEQLPYAYL